jgi:hypothetical protein
LLKILSGPLPLADWADIELKCGFFSEKVAMDWLKNVSNDDFNDFLPQLLEALKNETW